MYSVYDFFLKKANSFLKTCLKNKFIPVHLKKILQYEINTHHCSFIRQINRLKHNFIQKLVRIELNDTYRQLSHVRYELFTNYRTINSFLPFDICCAFFRHQEINFNKIGTKKITTLIKKIDNLRLC